MNDLSVIVRQNREVVARTQSGRLYNLVQRIARRELVGDAAHHASAELIGEINHAADPRPHHAVIAVEDGYGLPDAHDYGDEDPTRIDVV